VSVDLTYEADPGTSVAVVDPVFDPGVAYAGTITLPMNEYGGTAVHAVTLKFTCSSFESLSCGE
jgi:hypothetical protein